MYVIDVSCFFPRKVDNLMIQTLFLLTLKFILIECFVISKGDLFFFWYACVYRLNLVKLHDHIQE